LIKIVVTGAESTGKTTLAKSLAQYFNCPLRIEYSRVYLETMNGAYEQSDILHIARQQFQLEQKIIKIKPSLLICDTDNLVLKIWSEFKYGICDPWINGKIETTEVDLYILPHYDIPYEPDPLREHPDQRHILFQLYHDMLIQHKLTHFVVEGDPDARLNQSLDRINTLFKVN